MTTQEIIQLMGALPPSIKDIGILVVILSLVEISPIKLNPWKWLKSIAMIPQNLNDLSNRLSDLEHEFNDDRAFRWRSMIVNRGDRIQDGHKFRKEVWEDTIKTIGNYKKYCKSHPDFENELAIMTIEYLEKKYAEARDKNDYLR